MKIELFGKKIDLEDLNIDELKEVYDDLKGLGEILLTDTLDEETVKSVIDFSKLSSTPLPDSLFEAYLDQNLEYADFTAIKIKALLDFNKMTYTIENFKKINILNSTEFVLEDTEYIVYDYDEYYDAFDDEVEEALPEIEIDPNGDCIDEEYFELALHNKGYKGGFSEASPSAVYKNLYGQKEFEKEINDSDGQAIDWECMREVVKEDYTLEDLYMIRYKNQFKIEYNEIKETYKGREYFVIILPLLPN